MQIPHLGEKFTAEIEAKEPENMRELLSMYRNFRHLGEVCALKYSYVDDTGADRCKLFDLTSALEEKAPDYPLETFDDMLAAMDLLMELIDWNYVDHRDERLAQLIRDSIQDRIPRANPKAA